jgi:aspartate racemase
MMNMLAPVSAPQEMRCDGLTQPERRRLLAQFNDTQTPYPADSCVHELFERQTEAMPDRVAVVCGDETLTYSELNRRANRLAHYLRRLGAGPETLVALSMRRSLDLIVSTLGILKAGGAYLPLDAHYPAERIAFMLEDANAPILLTEESLLHKLPANNSNIVCIEREAETISRCDSRNPESGAKADNLAYVMYTSGSTGRPKGVMVEHRSIVRLVRNTNYADFTSDQVFLQFAPMTFDASTFEIWGALLNGARLAIMPDSAPSLEELGRAIKQYEVTTLWLTAGLFHLMVDERLEDLRPLRQLLVGGDVLSVTHVQQALDRLDCDLINGYGPTENTTFTCCHSIRERPIGNSVPIGKPIANTQVYILDSQLEPVRLGEVGELYIGGDGLARGYLNRADLTAERFVPSPFSEISSARLYKTGDLARFLPDGTIGFLGRADTQVKIRGYRIELEEIEITLTLHPGVRQAVVLAREIAAGDKQLVAFVVSRPGEEPEICKLRSYLEKKLPDYMIPAFLFTLDALPLDPNGKLDRRRLLEMIPHRQLRTSAFVEPGTETERTIASVFQNVLQVEKVGADDNFFDLGANSLQLARIHSRLQNVFNSDMKIIALFQNPTVSALAKFMNGAEESALGRAQARGARQREALARQKRIHKGIINE